MEFTVRPEAKPEADVNGHTMAKGSKVRRSDVNGHLGVVTGFSFNENRGGHTAYVEWSEGMNAGYVAEHSVLKLEVIDANQWWA